MSKLISKILLEYEIEVGKYFDKTIPHQYAFIQRDVTDFPSIESKLHIINKIDKYKRTGGAGLPETLIPINMLVATQDNLDSDRMFTASQQKQILPLIVKFHGIYYIIKGHNKIAHAIDEGSKYIKVKLFNLNKVAQLQEAVDREHFIERLKTRFLDVSAIPVGYELEGSRGKYVQVGMYTIPEDVKQQLIKNAEIVLNYNFPKGKSYAIPISGISIDRNKVEFYSDELKNESKNKQLVFVHDETSSNGNLVFMIIRNNEVYTIFFAKSYVPQTTDKLGVDHIVKIDTVANNKVR